MKNIYFITVLLLCAIATKAQSDKNLLRARIISKEEMTISGSFTFNLEVVAFDTCQLDSIRIINDGNYFTPDLSASNFANFQNAENMLFIKKKSENC